MVCYPCFWDYLSREYLHLEPSTVLFKKWSSLVLAIYDEVRLIRSARDI